MIVSQKYQDLLQPNSRNRSSKISRTFYGSRKLWIILVFLLRTLKEKLPIFLINNLLLHIPLLALTDRQNYRGRELQRNEYTRYVWAGGTFFPVVLLCQFFGCGGKSFRWYLPTIPIVLLCVFFVAAGNSFWLHRSVFWLLREKVLGVTSLPTIAVVPLCEYFGCGR